MISAEDVIGTWLLIGRGASEGHQAALLERYGEHSEGVAVLSPEGWLCAALGRGDRDPGHSRGGQNPPPLKAVV